MGIHALIAAALVAVSPVVEPDWVRKPSLEEIGEAYPPLAQAMRIPGSALLSCSITAKGQTRSCEVIGESPPGLGFGAAALSISPRFEVKPLTVSGLPVDGGVARFPIGFALPEEAPQPKLAAKPKPPEETMGLARKVLAATGAEQQATEGVNGFLAALQARQDPGVDPAIKAQAIETYGETMREMLAETLETAAGTYARAFTAPQLAEILAFYSSPTGQAFVKQQPRLAMEAWEASSGFEDAFANRWRSRFCRRAACADDRP